MYIYDKIVEFLRCLLSISNSAFLFIPLVFLISLISNSIPYVSIPYLALLLLYSSCTGINNVGYSMLIVLSSAVGAALGKVVIYYLGKGFSNVIIGEKNYTYVKLLSRLLDKSIFLAIMMFAATPLPDDILYIPVGVLKYPLHKFFLACLTGKVFLTAFVFYSGGLIHSVISISVSDIGSVSIISTIVSIMLTVITLILMRYIDWAQLVEIFAKYGLARGFFMLLVRFHKVLRRGDVGEESDS